MIDVSHNKAKNRQEIILPYFLFSENCKH